jgi:O-antigen ligase
VIEKFKYIGRLSLDLAWVAVIILLPITSFPILSHLAGNSMVAPASFIPLLFLVLFWLITYLFKRGRFPRENIPFFLFITVALVSSALAFFLNTPPFKAGTIVREEIRALITLTIGAAFFLVTSGWLAQSRSRLVSTLKWVNIGGLCLLIWSAIQGVYIFVYHGKYPHFFENLQHLISTGNIFDTRITGLAFEPSWLGHQLNLLFLPFWLAATITGWSTFRFRIWKFSLENIFLGCGVIVLFLASRVGTLSFLVNLAFLLIYLGFLLAKRIRLWSEVHLVGFSPLLQKSARTLLPTLIFLGILGVYGLGALSLVYVLSNVDPRFAAFFQIKSFAQFKSLAGNVYQLFNYLQFAERYVYWVAGWNIFNTHPIFGVGLGNAGFYFQHALPAYGWTLPEVVQIYFREPALPNIKSIWVRLLAETGIVGFSSFIVWFIVMFRTAWSMRLNARIPFKVIGWCGVLVSVAFLTEGFSTDTFALPYIWVSLGIVSAAGALLRNTKEQV